MVMEGLQEDMGDGNMQCINHPYKNSTPGGICAFCLQEKLGKLVSSSFPIAIFPSSSSSSSPSFRSDYGVKTSSTIPVHLNNLNTTNNGDSGFHYNQYYSRRTRIPFILTQKKKKKKDANMAAAAASSAPEQSGIVFKRSKSTATPGRGVHYLDSDGSDVFSPRKRGFWSFIYQSKHATSRKPFREISYGSTTTSTKMANTGTGPTGSFSQRSKEDEFVVIDENESPNQASMDRKVSRSRSVGCGSRSFSGDLFERISTGFGDCTLRRVESQREGKPKGSSIHRAGAGEQDSMKERVKCGGIFGGFMMNSSSSSSSSSSYWVSSAAEDGINGGRTAVVAPPVTVAGHMAHGRSKSWGWAFASPIRAFGKPSSGKREGSNKNTTPNLAAIPSLLTVRV